jgi:hypothetical protein
MPSFDFLKYKRYEVFGRVPMQDGPEPYDRSSSFLEIYHTSQCDFTDFSSVLSHHGKLCPLFLALAGLGCFLFFECSRGSRQRNRPTTGPIPGHRYSHSEHNREHQRTIRHNPKQRHERHDLAPTTESNFRRACTCSVRDLPLRQGLQHGTESED